MTLLPKPHNLARRSAVGYFFEICPHVLERKNQSFIIGQKVIQAIIGRVCESNVRQPCMYVCWLFRGWCDIQDLIISISTTNIMGLLERWQNISSLVPITCGGPWFEDKNIEGWKVETGYVCCSVVCPHSVVLTSRCFVRSSVGECMCGRISPTKGAST